MKRVPGCLALWERWHALVTERVFDKVIFAVASYIASQVIFANANFGEKPAVYRKFPNSRLPPKKAPSALASLSIGKVDLPTGLPFPKRPKIFKTPASL